MMDFEERYFDVLRALEQAIVDAYVANPDLADHQVRKVLEGHIRTFQAQVAGKRLPLLKITSREQLMYDAVGRACAWHLGRDPELPTPIVRTTEEIIDCLKRIERSINLMAEQGRRGYLDFVRQFFYPSS